MNHFDSISVKLEVYDILDKALRSRYLAIADLPRTAIWEVLPESVRAVYNPIGTLADLLPNLWMSRNLLLGLPVRTKDQQEASVMLHLGLCYLTYLDHRRTADDLLSRAFHIADSYICEIDARQFLRLRKELREDHADDGRIDSLFSPFQQLTVKCVRDWRLNPDVVDIIC